MLLILVVGLTAAFLPIATGTSLFNRNVGLLRAFKGTDENNNNRDTEVIWDPEIPAVWWGTDIGVPTGTFTAFGQPIDVVVCFQTGFCEAGATADTAWSITSPPTEDPANTGMAASHTNVLFAPYVFPLDELGTIYKMAYRTLDYANVYDQSDIEDILARYEDSYGGDKNFLESTTLTEAYKAFVVTWSITDVGGTGTSTFQLVMITDGGDPIVFYIYGEMGLTITNNVRGYIGGGASGNSARICSKFDTAAEDTDAALLDEYLPIYSNYKCGQPGNYWFKVEDTAQFCGVTGTECSTAFTSATPKAHCNATSSPMDSCLVSSYCQRNPANPASVTLTVTVKGYRLPAGVDIYMQALYYSEWQPDIAAAPLEKQVFVEKDASPVSGTGTCGKALTTSPETLSFEFDVWETSEKNKCGVFVDGTGTDQRIFFAAKIFEYTYDPTTDPDDFGPNAMIDKWGNMILTTECAPGDLVLSASQTIPNNGPSTPTALPSRLRKCELKAVDSIDDTGAVELPYVQLGQKYFLRICCDHGTPFNPQADPFGMHTTSCSVSNRADFTDTNPAEEAVQEFIAVTPTGESCPIVDGLTTPPMYMYSDFMVRSTSASYTPSDASFPANPWCIYTDAIRAARWNKFQSGAAVKKLWFKCTIGFCARFDFSATPSEGAQCIDNCAGAKRRKREVSNITESFPQEVLYTSVIYNEPKSALEEYCDAGSSDFTIALATVITLIALLCVAIVASLLVFVKLLRAAKRSEKGKRFK